MLSAISVLSQCYDGWDRRRHKEFSFLEYSISWLHRPSFFVLVRISAAVQPVEEGFLADLNQPAATHRRKARRVYQLIGAGSGNPHDMLNICNIQNQGQRIIVVPFRFSFISVFLLYLNFLTFHFPHICRSTCSVSFMLPCSTYISH